MPHIISPTTLGLSFCQGHCNHESSYPALFAQFTRRVFDTGKYAGEQCCHGVEFEHLEIIYINDKKEIRSELVYDIIATKCACN
ncbi:hypothetical protein PFISCL1PPCAC_27680 [Pristionchus fissidentatus]|uniref:TGF-beta family profile domain-containing protein n=1 Tax=Pristionchus fissidentatus TaxID=1538716 RepID=A0AAV5X031_9BILA|nr:hypothetical protein PFISCL1PPCAC_27680 [Pristionchus fissidentatus]